MTIDRVVPSPTTANLPLYTCTHTFKVSFSLCGTLAFAACFRNLTSKGLGHLSLSVFLSLSLHHFPLRACMHMRSHYSSARAYTAPPKREASKVKHRFELRARSWTIGNISVAKKEKKQQRGQMFAQPTSVQVFPLVSPIYREASGVANDIPEESDQFRFLRPVCYGNIKGY